MTNNIIKFEYKNNEVAFEKGNDVMVNATMMAKPFGKQPIDWLKTEQAKEFIATYSKLRNISLADLQKVTRGGNNPGTWLHKGIALEFARYLSPEFAIWTNDRLEELITKGHTEINRVPTKFSEALRLAAEQAEIIEKQKELIAIQTPKAEYYDSFMERESLTCFRDTAKQIGIGQKEFIEWLTKKRYIFRNQKNQIRPYMGYCDSMLSGSDNYFRMKDFVDKSGGKVGQQVLITTKGKEHFAKLLAEEKVSQIEELIKDADYTINGN